MYYLNTNAQIILFQDTLNSEIYVDKSMLIEKISPMIRTNSKYICITRPRRFGKTVNANMLGRITQKDMIRILFFFFYKLPVQRTLKAISISIM